MHRYTPTTLLLVLALVATAGWGLFGSAPAAWAQDGASSAEAARVKVLLDEINRQQIEIQVLREELARTELRASRAERELEEIQQFMADHDNLGAAYEEYQGVKAIAEREQRRLEAEAARQRYEQVKAERRASS